VGGDTGCLSGSRDGAAPHVHLLKEWFWAAYLVTRHTRGCLCSSSNVNLHPPLRNGLHDHPESVPGHAPAQARAVAGQGRGRKVESIRRPSATRKNFVKGANWSTGHSSSVSSRSESVLRVGSGSGSSRSVGLLPHWVRLGHRRAGTIVTPTAKAKRRCPAWPTATGPRSRGTLNAPRLSSRASIGSSAT
jgi:hypothetical protein